MLKIDRQVRTFRRLDQRDLPQTGLKERIDIQQMIRNSPDDFFEELGERLLLIAEEVRPDEFVEDRIDLLAIDKQGATIVIELKRGSHKLHLLQALTYAAMVSKWDQDRLVAERARLTGRSSESVVEEVEQFLEEDIAELNESQRIMLLAGDFDYEALITAEWLTEKHGVDIRCVRLDLAKDGDTEFLTCTGIYPPPELTKHAIRRARESRPAKWGNWGEALQSLDNPAMTEFFKRELAGGRENYLPKRALRYRIDGKRRFHVGARRGKAYVWQSGRFKGDQEFWIAKLGAQIDVKPVKDGVALRFYLQSAGDFSGFQEALEQDLTTVEFMADDAPDIEDEE